MSLCLSARIDNYILFAPLLLIPLPYRGGETLRMASFGILFH